MKIFEIGTGYTSIPAKIGAATEIVVEELTTSMLKQGHDVTIVDIRDIHRQSTSLPIIEVNVPYFFSSTDLKLGLVHKLKRVLYSMSLTYKLHRLLRKQKSKVILHFHNQYNLFFFLKLTPVKVRSKIIISYTIHSYIWQGDWDDIKDIIHKRYFKEVYCCKQADKVFALNEKTTEHLRYLKVDPKKINLIANGVNTLIYHPLSISKRNELIQQMKLEKKNVFFQAGSICERKNQLTSLKLLLPLMKENKSIVFIYAGGVISTEYKMNIDNFIIFNNISEQVFYVGELKPGKVLNEYYNISKAFLFPSTSEGFSLVILEAMSAGVPVLIDAKSGLKLPNEGKIGCLCYENEFDFKEKVRTYILNEENRNHQSQQARHCIEEEYSWNIIANEYIKQMKNNC